MNKNQFVGKSYELVDVEGYMRIFNKVAARGVWKNNAQEPNVATLNVEKKLGSSFNCLIFEVDQKQFDKLKEREKGYSPIEVDVKLCDNSVKKLAFMFILDVTGKTKEGILPVPKYLSVCRDGAYSFGENFGLKFDCTTFLADGRSIKDYLTNLSLK